MFAALDWRDQGLYTYLAAGGAVVIALALALYALPGSKVKVPGVVLAMVGGIALGLAGGVILMGTMGYDMRKIEAEGPPPGAGDASNMMANMGGMPPGMPGRGGPGGGRG